MRAGARVAIKHDRFVANADQQSRAVQQRDRVKVFGRILDQTLKNVHGCYGDIFHGGPTRGHIYVDSDGFCFYNDSIFKPVIDLGSVADQS